MLHKNITVYENMYNLCLYVCCNSVSLIWKYVENNKAADIDWFRLESNKEGTRWFGKCWYIHELLKYEFDVEFDVSVCKLVTDNT